MVDRNLLRVKERIASAVRRAGRDPNTVKLVVVTKEADEDGLRAAIECGETDFGENRVADAKDKIRTFGSEALKWHMIGHLQSNKARSAVKIFSLIHSLDSIRLAQILGNEAKKRSKRQEVLVEVNVSGEKSKFGIGPDELAHFLEVAGKFENINIKGLMTMAPLGKDPEEARPHFRRLRELRDKFGLKELSMGMTEDFEVAVEEGATMVRVGSAIFKNSV
ncbi:MAG: YggS family pyridoxal phosphate-dependent enzyme [Candidatus Omnitrophota bacterium]